MKNIYYSILFILTFVVSACNDLLEEDPQYASNSVTVFQDENTAQLALYGCYAHLTSFDVYGQVYWEFSEGASGLMWAQTNQSDQDRYASLRMTARDGLTRMVWDGFYKTIAECNLFIKGINDSPLSDDFKAYSVAQAKFIRGLCFYNLMVHFGEIPLRNSENLGIVNLPRASLEQVVGQIEQDFQESATGLKLMESDSSIPTQNSAYAMLTKLYWYLGSKDQASNSAYWAKAKQYGDLVVGKYSLESSYSNLFNANVRDSKESIFKINFPWEAPSGYGNRSSWVFSPQNSIASPAISWGRFRFTKAFHDDFRATHPGDPRYSATFLTQWVDKNKKDAEAYPVKMDRSNRVPKDISIPYNQLSNPANPSIAEIEAIEPATVKAFVASGADHQGWPYLKKTMDLTQSAQLSKKNFIVYRYADFLLLMADVENELGNVKVAVGHVNTVLARARNSSSPASLQPANLSETISQADLRTAIFRERQFELAGECHSFSDLRRRGTEFLKLAVDRHNNHEITKAHSPELASNRFYDRLFPQSEDELRTNLLFPIPQEELDTNEKIGIENQNPGY